MRLKNVEECPSKNGNSIELKHKVTKNRRWQFIMIPFSVEETSFISIVQMLWTEFGQRMLRIILQTTIHAFIGD